MRTTALYLLILVASTLLPLRATAGTPAATAIDTIVYDALNGNLLRASVLYVLSVSTTPDTITLPLFVQNIEITAWGATTDTVQISTAQGTAAPKYSTWVRGTTAMIQQDYGKAYIKKIIIKGKSTTFPVWLRAY